VLVGYDSCLCRSTFKGYLVEGSSEVSEVSEVFGTFPCENLSDAIPQDEHQSWTAKRAEQANSRSMKNVKSDAVRQAMERRAKAQADAAKKGRK